MNGVVYFVLMVGGGFVLSLLAGKFWHWMYW
jgi:hypothetical protein